MNIGGLLAPAGLLKATRGWTNSSTATAKKPQLAVRDRQIISLFLKGVIKVHFSPRLL
jgi:hypothetical protein